MLKIGPLNLLIFPILDPVSGIRYPEFDIQYIPNILQHFRGHCMQTLQNTNLN